MGQTQEFLAISPLGKIPVYQDGDLAVGYLVETTAPTQSLIEPMIAHGEGTVITVSSMLVIASQRLYLARVCGVRAVETARLARASAKPAT